VSNKKKSDWAEAKRRCRLNEEEIRMAKELGMAPRSLINNILSPQQRWKQPVKQWVRDLYEQKFGRRGSTPRPPAARWAQSKPQRSEPDDADELDDIPF
jgi:hypothetical protein